jgi:CDP-glucose 4,6-dehydratase
MVMDDSFFKGKKILITGHTGFKGSWLSLLLSYFKSDIYGFALEPPTSPSLFNEARVENYIKSYIGDIRDYKLFLDTVEKIKPEIIIHMAAQPLVRQSYKDPVETYSTNVIGVVNLFEVVRQVPGIKVVLNVTTDKCYENREWHWGYRENEPLGGYDPYSSSKACSELVTAAYRNSYFNPEFFKDHGVAIATARAGNVVGGGDWAEGRLIPDFIKAIVNNKPVVIRSPRAIRPWQHVLEPLTGYLSLVEKLYMHGQDFVGAWNFGPDDIDAKNVEWIVDNLYQLWGDGAGYKIEADQLTLHEAHYLKLDCSKAKALLEWHPKWHIDHTIKSIVEWNQAFLKGDNILDFTFGQIKDYLNN